MRKVDCFPNIEHERESASTLLSLFAESRLEEFNFLYSLQFGGECARARSHGGHDNSDGVTFSSISFNNLAVGRRRISFTNC